MRCIRMILTIAGLLAIAGCQPSATPVPATGHDTPASSQSAASPGNEPAHGLPSAPPPTPVTHDAAEHWQCGEILLDAQLDGAVMRLNFSGRTLGLAHGESLTGARYADAKGNEFMRQGDGATLILSGDEGRACTRSTRVSTWIEAATRGIGFRAVGSEPGWFVEVGKSNTPSLHATLDYGDRTIEVAHTQVAGTTYSGTSTDGVAVALEITHEPCHEGMSGEGFEASAQLRVGDRNYRGCGAFLVD